MYLHGCAQTVDGPSLTWDFKNLYQGGYLEYAAANNIILLMPQARYSAFNKFQCFEVENYNNWFDEQTFMTKKGAQMNALSQMLQRVTEPRSDYINYESRNILTMNDFEFFFFNQWRFWISFPNMVEASVGPYIIYYISVMLSWFF